MYVPKIEYRNPSTGRQDRFTQSQGSGHEFHVGQDVTLADDVSTNTVMLRSLRRRAEDLLVALVGLVMIGLAVRQTTQ